MRYLLFFLGIKCDGASRSALKQRFTESVEYIGRDSGLLIANGGLFLYLLQTLVDGLKIFDLKLNIYYLLVADGIHCAVHMGYVIVVKAAQYMDNGIALAYVAQELVAQTLALAGTLDQSGYIDNLNGSGDYPARANKFGQFG
jgi:hypothetical protein